MTGCHLGSVMRRVNCARDDVGDTRLMTVGLTNNNYTVMTSNVKAGAETPSTVDIGFHYVACANSVPIDTDGDGLADYYEDRDGDGNGLEELTDWNNAHTISNSYTDLQSLEFAAIYLVNDRGQDYANEQNTQFQPSLVVLGDTVIVGYWDSNRGVYAMGDHRASWEWANLGICRMVAYSVSIDGGADVCRHGRAAVVRGGVVRGRGRSCSGRGPLLGGDVFRCDF